jgi:hypothetical protein
VLLLWLRQTAHTGVDGTEGAAPAPVVVTQWATDADALDRFHALSSMIFACGAPQVGGAWPAGVGVLMLLGLGLLTRSAS